MSSSRALICAFTTQGNGFRSAGGRLSYWPSRIFASESPPRNQSSVARQPCGPLPVRKEDAAACWTPSRQCSRQNGSARRLRILRARFGVMVRAGRNSGNEFQNARMLFASPSEGDKGGVSLLSDSFVPVSLIMGGRYSSREDMMVLSCPGVMVSSREDVTMEAGFVAVGD